MAAFVGSNPAVSTSWKFFKENFWQTAERFWPKKNEHKINLYSSCLNQY